VIKILSSAFKHSPKAGLITTPGKGQKYHVIDFEDFDLDMVPDYALLRYAGNGVQIWDFYGRTEKFQDEIAQKLKEGWGYKSDYPKIGMECSSFFSPLKFSDNFFAFVCGSYRLIRYIRKKGIEKDIVLFRLESLLDTSCFANDDERQKLSIYPAGMRQYSIEKYMLPDGSLNTKDILSLLNADTKVLLFDETDFFFDSVVSTKALLESFFELSQHVKVCVNKYHPWCSAHWYDYAKWGVLDDLTIPYIPL
jgi:hypothetical protein